ncbi:DUF4271 domain-containing protein [Pedobacter sp.]|uniref:DUF4271 domain-containing protein n=1 Tax=Pedobacter sp. TaxID=1411316 RepID=UPI003D7F6315
MKTLILFLWLMTGAWSLQAQEIPVPAISPDTPAKKLNPYRVVKDSAFYARQKFVTDSIIHHTWILDDSLLSNTLIMDSIMKANLSGKSTAAPWYTLHGKGKKESLYQKGKPLPKGQVWVLAFIAFLLLIFAILKRYFSRQLYTIVQAFFSNRVLNNLYKEDNLFTSWPFLLLFVQFGFVIGMFFYMVTQYYQISYGAGGFRFFLTISVLILGLYTGKIILLKLLGHIFNIQKVVHEYIIILYLSYFNLSLLFIPLVVAFALSSIRYGLNYIIISLLITGLIFTFQFFRAGINILSHYRFLKVYLFLYFCALEICPILILIKAVGI